jgi:glycosyltransferase involved in cell wall biosynthesis
MVGSISGLKTFDYISHKMPILSSIMDEKSRLITNDRIGWIVDSFDPDEYFKVIKRAIEEYDIARQNIEANYEHYVNEYSWRNRFKMIFDLNIKLINDEIK